MTLRVSDNGPGIPADRLPHIFERFYPAESSRNRASGGAGLGLAICQRIADAHGSTLTAESRQLTLPLHLTDSRSSPHS